MVKECGLYNSVLQNLFFKSIFCSFFDPQGSLKLVYILYSIIITYILIILNKHTITAYFFSVL